MLLKFLNTKNIYFVLTSIVFSCIIRVLLLTLYLRFYDDSDFIFFSEVILYILLYFFSVFLGTIFGSLFIKKDNFRLREFLALNSIILSVYIYLSYYLYSFENYLALLMGDQEPSEIYDVHKVIPSINNETPSLELIIGFSLIFLLLTVVFILLYSIIMRFIIHKIHKKLLKE